MALGEVVLVPLEGGAKLLIELKARSRRWKSAAVDAGFFEQGIATTANIQEYGATQANIPPRAFMRTTFMLRNQEWRDSLAAELREGKTAKEALKTCGLAMGKNIRETLQNAPQIFQANAKATVRKKGFDFALLETGAMFKAVRYQVRAAK
jgi:hypothetical protein